MEITFVQAPKTPPPVTPKPALKWEPPTPLPAPVVVVPPVTPTSEDIKARARDALGAMGFNVAKEFEASETLPPEVPPVAPAPAEPPPVTPAPAAPVVEPTPEPPPTTEDIIRRTAAETAAALRTEPTAPATPPAVLAFEMSPEDERDYRVLLFLGQTQPDKFAGKAAQWLEYVKKHYAYQDKWAAENPDKKYDPSDEEHGVWFEANAFEVDRRVLDDAFIDMRVEERVEHQLKPGKAKEKLQEALPQIAQRIDAGVVRLLENAAPELAEMAKTNGKVVLTPENAAKLHEADPIAAGILDVMVTQRLEPLLYELEKTMLGDDFKLRPNQNPVHAQIDRYRATAEAQMANAPAEARIIEGRNWVTVAAMADLRRTAMNLPSLAERERRLAEINAHNWCLTVDDLSELIIDDYGKEARWLIAQTDGLARKKYVKAPASTPATAQPTPAPTPLPPQPTTVRTRPPSITSTSDVVTTANSGRPGPDSAGEVARKVMFGR